MDTSSPRKRTRIDPSVSATLRALELEQAVPPAPPPRSHLENLPVELLSEVLSYMPTPNDLLNVTRASRYLCLTLLNKGNIHIWVSARKNCVTGEVPEPPPGWSEPAHAALIFDGGHCEECGHYTKRMLVSFAVEARLCGNNICRRTFFKNKLILPRVYGQPALQTEVRKRLAYIEDVRAFGQRAFITHTLLSRYYRKSNYQDVVNMYNNRVITGEGTAAEAETAHEKEIAANARKQEHFTKLATYRAHYEQRYQSVKSSNVQLVQRWTDKRNWNIADVMAAPMIKAMLTTANRCIQKVKESDLDIMADVLKQEINKTIAKRDRCKTEHSMQQRRADVEKYYNSLKSQANASRVLPPLSDFRRLPFILHLQNKDAPSILNDLRTDGNLPNSALQSDLNAWVKKQHADFQRLLGYEQWRDPNPDVLSPVERINARFICTTCGTVPRKLEEQGSFDFASACNHQCTNMEKRKRRDHIFSSAQFTGDLKGKAVIESAARLVDVDLNVAGADVKLNSLGVRFLCKTCPGRIIMPFLRLSGHASRHDIMEIELLSPEDAAALLDGMPYERGAKLKYLHKQLGPQDGVKRKALGKLKAERYHKAFLCRHCHTLEVPDDPTRTSKNEKKPLMMDGLVSHMKSRHGFEIMGDEDFFRVTETASAGAPASQPVSLSQPSLAERTVTVS